MVQFRMATDVPNQLHPVQMLALRLPAHPLSDSVAMAWPSVLCHLAKYTRARTSFLILKRTSKHSVAFSLGLPSLG